MADIATATLELVGFVWRAEALMRAGELLFHDNVRHTYITAGAAYDAYHAADAVFGAGELIGMLAALEEATRGVS